MKMSQSGIGKLFLSTALVMLVLGLSLGILAGIFYLHPKVLSWLPNFQVLRPMHVSAAIFWIVSGAIGCVYYGMLGVANKPMSANMGFVQWLLWVIAILGVFYSYFNKDFGGREYWEFNPKWALPIAIAWCLLLINFTRAIYRLKHWPVYVWMWLTGIVFFLFTFLENYLWVFPYFRENIVKDMTIQWKVNGSLVGAWNQILYGTAFFLMDKIEGVRKVGASKVVFTMFFLGLFNLMFNWGHHIYTLPTQPYIRYIGYAVSMTEWVFFIRIVITWKKSVSDIQRNYHYFPYRFLMAADIWVFLNMGQAILMSIPAINRYSHGTHVTVAHAMGTTIGINSMILFAACFEFIGNKLTMNKTKMRVLNLAFWFAQVGLFVFWLSLNLAGVKKAIWQTTENHGSYSKMMDSLFPYFSCFFIAGIFLLIALVVLSFILLQQQFKLKEKVSSNLNEYPLS